jgi:hypothetical protein
MTQVAKQALAMTDKNLRASFEHARKLMQAKILVMQLQSDILRNRFGIANRRTQKDHGGGCIRREGFERKA